MADVPQLALLDGDIRLLGGLGQRLFRLLAAIESTGSINQAAREVGLTYKGAWEMIERANNLAPQLLVKTAVGGKQGGGTCLSPLGKALLQLFVELEQEHQQFLQDINSRLSTNQNILILLKRLTMKSSARNQFFGTVTEVSIGAVNATVVLTLKGGESLVASVTKESVAALDIKVGIDAVALIKAPQVILVTDFGGYRVSARNQLQGVITRIHQGEVNAEVVLELPGGDSVASTLTNDSVVNLGLAVGNPATAIFKAGAVVLAVAMT